MLQRFKRKRQELINAPDRKFSLLMFGYITALVVGFLLLVVAWIFNWNNLESYGEYLLFGSIGAHMLNSVVLALTATLLKTDIDKSIEDIAKDAIKAIDSTTDLEQIELVLKYRFVEIARSEEEADKRIEDFARVLEENE